MENAMAVHAVPNEELSVSNGRRWASRIIIGLIALFMLFDAVMKFVAPKPVADAFARTGWRFH